MSVLIYIVNSTWVFVSVQFITLTYFDSLAFSIYWYFIVSKLYVGTNKKIDKKSILKREMIFQKDILMIIQSTKLKKQ